MGGSREGRGEVNKKDGRVKGRRKGRVGKRR